MLFKDAYMAMLAGHKIKRPCFEGYWYINGVDGKLKIHLASGKEISEGELGLTVMNCCAEDWYIAEYTDVDCSKDDVAIDDCCGTSESDEINYSSFNFDTVVAPALTNIEDLTKTTKIVGTCTENIKGCGSTCSRAVNNSNQKRKVILG